MSQAGEIDVIGTHPEIATDFVANVGTAVPIANTIEILGLAVAAGSIPVETVASGNTLTVQVQRSQEIASTDATKVGLAAFDSSAFDVDANGFVTLAGGGGATTNIDVDAHTAPGTDPVVPSGGNIVMTGGQVASGVVGTNVIRTNSVAANTVTIEIQRSTAVAATDITKNGVSHFNSTEFSVDSSGFVSLLGGSLAIDSIGTQTGTNPIVPTVAGLVTINGAVVAAGTNPVRSDGTGANTMAIEVQISQALAATDATKIGLSNYNSAHFSVDANGFVSLAGGGLAIDSIHPDSGTDPVVPTVAGLVNIIGSGSTTTIGSLNTLTVQLTGLTNHAILVGAGTTTITKVGPTATIGQVLQSAGSSADPAFSTATYPLTTTINQILYSSAANTITGLATANRGVLTTTSAGVPVITALATDGQLIIGSTAGAPAAASITSSDGSVTVTPGSNSISLTVTGGTSVGKTITGNTGGALSPTAGNWNIVGTGSTTASGSVSTLTVQLTGLTNHALQIGAGTATLTQLGSGTTGQVLQTNTSADPTWSTATYPSTTTVNQILYSSATNTVTGLATANNSILSTDGSGVPSLGTSLSNDYTFTTATAGTTRTLTVSNTNNSNTASNSVVNSSVGGTSSGDPWNQFTVGTARSYSVGVDTSDSQKFKINTNNSGSVSPSSGTNIMTMTSGGNATFPATCAFSIVLSANQANVTGDGTAYTIAYNSSTFDQNSNFNTGTFTFTAPVAGRYLLVAAQASRGYSASFTNGRLQITTTGQTFFTWLASPGKIFETATAVNIWDNTGVVICNMAANDTATVQLVITGSTKTIQVDSNATGGNTYFAGHLLC